MKFDHFHYVPCLRWKQGEYQALMRLNKDSKGHLTPLIEVAEIGWDFETKTLKKTIDEHLFPVAKRIKDKWNRRCFVDLNIIDPSARMLDGKHPVEFVFNDLRSKKIIGVPVTGLERDKDYNGAVANAHSIDKNGMCLRLKLEQAAKPNLQSLIDVFMHQMNIKLSECDVVFDLGSPNYVPIEGISKLVQIYVQKLPYINQWRTFTIVGGSFPSTVAEIKGPLEIINRYEWILYKELSKNLKYAGARIPTFGDYTISHPDVVMLDMRLVKPAAKLIYSIDDAYYVRKGPNVRDNGFAQYHRYCQELVNSKYFTGYYFSAGDGYIYDCANKTQKPGHLPTWKWVSTNHHMEKLIADISNFSYSLGTLER